MAKITTLRTRRVDPESAQDWRRRTTFAQGGPYKPPAGNVVGDALRSIPSALANAGESAIGAAGDIAELRNMLAMLIAQKGKKMGSSFDQTGNIEDLQRYRSLPTSAEIAAFNDRWMPPSLQSAMRYQPQTPFGMAAGFGTEMLADPTSLVPALKGLRLARKAF